jgi:Tfp pilus assembly protein FimT
MGGSACNGRIGQRDGLCRSNVKMQPINHTRQSGHSLIELSFVVAVVMILGAIAITTFATAVANIKLRGAASDFAGLVQQARLTAVKKNATYTVLFNLTSGHGAYIDTGGSTSGSAPNGSYDTGEPMIQFGGNVNQVAAPGGASGTPTNLDATSTPLGWTATSGNISFNSRGLTCDSTATPCGTNVNYIFYFRDTRSSGSHSWAAVSITAAARSKVWWWDGSSWIN